MGRGGEENTEERLVSLLHAQLVRVHQRLSRTEEQLRDERTARRALEREVQSLYAELETASSSRASRRRGAAFEEAEEEEEDRDEAEEDRSPASPTRRLVEDAVEKAVRARSEADGLRARLAEAEAAAAEGRAAVVEKEALRRALNNLNVSFEEQERQMRHSLELTDDELRRLTAEKARYAALSEKMYLVCEEFHMVAYGDDAGAPPPDSAAGPRPPAIPEEEDDDEDLSGDAEATAAASLAAHADVGYIEPCEWDGGADEMMSSPTPSPPPSPERPSAA